MGIEDWKLTVHKKAANCHLMVDVMKGKESFWFVNYFLAAKLNIFKPCIGNMIAPTRSM